MPISPELIGIAKDQLLTLPYYKVNKVIKASAVPYPEHKMMNQQVLTWNIARVIGKRRLNSGSGVRVGVIDTGIDFHHPDLASNVKGGVNILSPSLPPMDENGHGTHIAGIIGALNNHYGVVGVATEGFALCHQSTQCIGKRDDFQFDSRCGMGDCQPHAYFKHQYQRGKVDARLCWIMFFKRRSNAGFWWWLQPETPERRRGRATPFRFRRGWPGDFGGGIEPE